MQKTRQALGSVAVLAALALTAAMAQAQDASASKEKEQSLLATLRSDAPGGEKALACKNLAIHGSEAAVPELAKLLGDEKLASWARIALEAIPGPAANEALRKAAETLEGRLLIGTINSIGVRRDAQAVEGLSKRLQDQDEEVASAAAVALGRIGNADATKALRQSLAAAGPAQSAVAEGCILCAERLLADGKASEAAEIYDEVRQADVPKPRIQEATRGAILARKADGIPLLVEQLRSPDKGLLHIGLGVARELPDRQVTEALAAELSRTTQDRAVLLLYALADRADETIPPAVLEVARNAPNEVRMAALNVIGRKGDAASLPLLLDVASESDQELSQAAKTALVELPGEKVDAEIIARLPKADAKTLAVLLDLVGQRRIDAAPALLKMLDNSDATVRTSALRALGETAGPQQLGVLISQVVKPKYPGDAAAAQQALHAACVRMPDREATAAELAAAMPRASVPTQSKLLEILGAMGGTKALQTMVAAVKGKQEELQDTGSRLLGEWMSLDAGPALLDLSKTAPDKYKIRALRGYIRLARQFTMEDSERAQMCQNALAASTRADEQQLVLAVLERYPSPQTLQVAIKATQIPAIKEDASRVALAIAQKLGDKGANTRELLNKIGLEPVKIEIVKAEYGAGSTQKDVTEVLKKHVSDVPLIALPSANYSASFGGDPVPGTVKQLRIQYRINGKPGEATFAENAVIMLPLPK